MQVTSGNFEALFAEAYDRRAFSSEEEYEEDFKRFSLIARLLKRYKTKNDLRERVILNNCVILYNCAGSIVTNLLAMKASDHHKELFSFLAYMNRLPPEILLNGSKIDTMIVGTCPEIDEILRRL